MFVRERCVAARLRARIAVQGLLGLIVTGGSMRPIRRLGVSKGRSAAKFRRNVRRTKAPNMNGPMRGGWRL